MPATLPPTAQPPAPPWFSSAPNPPTNAADQGERMTSQFLDRALKSGQPATTQRPRCSYSTPYFLIWLSPVLTSSVHSFGSGSHNLPSPICNGIHKYRESHCVFGFHMSPRKITVVDFVPTTFNIMVDCEP